MSFSLPFFHSVVCVCSIQYLKVGSLILIFLGITRFRDRRPYTDNPIADTEAKEDGNHIIPNSNDQVLLGQCELIKAQEERIDEVVQEIQPEILGFAEASSDHPPFGRTDLGSKQGNTKLDIDYFNILRGSMMIPHDY